MTVIKLSEPVEDIVVNLLRLANTKLPADVGWALEAAAGWETGEVAYTQLGAIMENVKKGVDANEALEKAKKTYGRLADAAKYIDPRHE